MKPNFVSAAEAAKLIKSHDRVFIQGSTSIPEVLLDAITRNYAINLFRAVCSLPTASARQ